MEQAFVSGDKLDAAWQAARYEDVAQTALTAARDPDFNPGAQLQLLRRGLLEAQGARYSSATDPQRLAEVVTQYDLAIRAHTQGIPFVDVLGSVAHYRASEGLVDFDEGVDRSESVSANDTYLLLAAGLLNDALPTV